MDLIKETKLAIYESTYDNDLKQELISTVESCDNDIDLIDTVQAIRNILESKSDDRTDETTASECQSKYNELSKRIQSIKQQNEMYSCMKDGKCKDPKTLVSMAQNIPDLAKKQKEISTRLAELENERKRLLNKGKRLATRKHSFE
jgi:hypothetical protein